MSQDDQSGGGRAPFFGELYLRTTRPFLAGPVTDAEVAYLRRFFFPPLPPGPVLDLGCGDGRHLAGLAECPAPLVGLDFDPLSLREARGDRPLIRGDFRALPIKPGALAGAYALYSTLFFGEEDPLPLLKGLREALRPGGVLLLQTVPAERLAESPEATFLHSLPDGGSVHDQARFDQATGLEHGVRTLKRPDGSVLSGPYTIRYYSGPQLHTLLQQAGLTVSFEHGDLDGGALTDTSRDLLVGAERRNG